MSHNDELVKAKSLAQTFHEAYERLAPEHGYATRKESAVAWLDVPAHNKNLMIAVCAEIEGGHIEPLRQLVRDFEAWAMGIAPHSYQEGRGSRNRFASACRRQ